MYRVKVNGTYQYQVENENNQLQIDGLPVVWDVQPIDGHRFSILWNDKSFEAELVEMAAPSRHRARHP